MNRIAKIAAAGLVAALVSFGPAGAASAADEPCAAQQAKVTKAEGALARVTAVFEKRQAKVKKAKKQVVLADTAAERGTGRQGPEDHPGQEGRGEEGQEGTADATAEGAAAAGRVPGRPGAGGGTRRLTGGAVARLG